MVVAGAATTLYCGGGSFSAAVNLVEAAVIPVPAALPFIWSFGRLGGLWRLVGHLA